MPVWKDAFPYGAGREAEHAHRRAGLRVRLRDGQEQVLAEPPGDVDGGYAVGGAVHYAGPKRGLRWTRWWSLLLLGKEAEDDAGPSRPAGRSRPARAG